MPKAFSLRELNSPPFSIAGTRVKGIQLPNSRKTGIRTTGKPIAIDFVGCYEGYTTDTTRMCSLGQLPQNVLEAFKYYNY